MPDDGCLLPSKRRMNMSNLDIKDDHADAWRGWSFIKRPTTITTLPADEERKMKISPVLFEAFVDARDSLPNDNNDNKVHHDVRDAIADILFAM